jgi:hypothetical protein
LTENNKDTIQNLSAQNVRTSQILEYMVGQYGGKQNHKFKKKKYEQPDCSRKSKAPWCGY